MAESQPTTVPRLLHPRKPSDNDKVIGARIRAQRQSVGISAHELAGQIGVSPQSLNKIERGLVCASAARLLQVATVLRCSVARLLPADETVDAYPPDPAFMHLACMWRHLGEPSREALLHVARALHDKGDHPHD